MKKFLMGILLIIVITVIAVVLHNTNASAVKTLEENNDSSSSESADADVVITDSYFIQSTNIYYVPNVLISTVQGTRDLIVNVIDTIF